MISPNYQMYSPKNWREMDIFCQLTNVIGRKWPDLFRLLLPFLVLSIMQNIDRYLDRNIKRSRCQEDIDVFSRPQTRIRSAALLKDRTINTMDGIVQENILVSTGWDFPLDLIHVPVIIIHGNLDNVSPPGAAKMLAEQLHDAQLHMLSEKATISCSMTGIGYSNFAQGQHLKSWMKCCPTPAYSNG